METKLEVVIIQANIPFKGDGGVYWLLSRSQLEFILTEVAVFSTATFAAAGQYRDTTLPVISLERHFGLSSTMASRSPKYLVLRAGDANGAVIRLIAATPQSLRLEKLSPGLGRARGVTLPKHSDDLLASYVLPGNIVALVPDIAAIGRSLQAQAAMA